MKHTKDITVTVTVRLCPAERRALNYKWLRTLYAIPQREAAHDATACTRTSAKRFISTLLGQEIDRLTLEYLTAKKESES